MTPVHRILAGLFALYLAQGLFFGYFTALNARYLLSQGLTLREVGLFGVVALLPFAIKILLGIVSDRFNLLGMGHRKPYIALGLSIQALGLVVLSTISPATDFQTFLLVAFLGQVGMALYDGCTDGLAVDLLPKTLMGRVHGLMGAGRSTGILVAALVGGWLAQHLGWPSVFWALAALTVVTLLSLTLLPEPQRSPEQTFSWKAFGVLAEGATWLRLVLAVLVAGVSLGANQLMTPELSARFSLAGTVVGLMGATWAVGGLIGALLGGSLYDRLGAERSVMLALLALAAAITGLTWAPTVAAGFALVFLFGVSFGVGQATTFASLMARSHPRAAAASFSALMMIVNLGYAFGVGMAGAQGARWGASTVMNSAAALLCGAALLMGAWLAMQRQARLAVQNH